MVKLIVSYVDTHVIVEQPKSVRVFNDVVSAMDYIREALNIESSPVQPIEQ